MAGKRMFALAITESDAFIGMDLSTQALYFHLSMKADDDGFVSNAMSTINLIGASEEDLKELIRRNFILKFESGIMVITHWRINNFIRKDRYKETLYLDERDKLYILENGKYTLEEGGEKLKDHLLKKWSLKGQPSIDKNREDKNRLEQERGDKTELPSPNSSVNTYGIFENVELTDDQYKELHTIMGSNVQKMIDRLSSYMESTGKKYHNHYATLRHWYEEDKEALNNKTYTGDPSEYESEWNLNN